MTLKKQHWFGVALSLIPVIRVFGGFPLAIADILTDAVSQIAGVVGAGTLAIAPSIKGEEVVEKCRGGGCKG